MSDRGDNWRPSATLDVLRTRADLLSAARAFFDRHGVMEIETPALAEYTVTDPNIAAPAVRLAARPDREYFLQTSPEYAMKRLLAAGSPDIYQICKVFRDGELGRRHQPEFTLVEWYRRGLSLDDMIDETCRFIAALFAAAGTAARAPAIIRHHYADVFRSAIGLDPLTADLDSLRECAEELVPGLSDELRYQLGDQRCRWLDLLMSHAVVPELAAGALTVVHHYPAQQAALARLDPQDPRFAERFEIFCAGIELANGYRELTDAREQSLRFAADLRQRAADAQSTPEPDPLLLAALAHGLPACCGVAVGFDRLLMCVVDAESITEVVSFAY